VEAAAETKVCFDVASATLSVLVPNFLSRESIRGFAEETKQLIIRGGSAGETDLCREFKKLKKVDMHDCVFGRLPDGCFARCEALASVETPSRLTEVGARAFQECSSLHGIFFSQRIGVLGEESFRGSGVLRMGIPSVRRVEKGCFVCTNLTGVNFRDLKSIGESAFARTKLKAVMLPDSTTKVGKGAFAECAQLAWVVLGKGVKSLGSGAFRGCVSLKKVRLGEGILEWGKGCFAGCVHSIERLELMGKDMSNIDGVALWPALRFGCPLV
jgi:hypothetical protein